jgi:hypothetical protein
MDRGTVECEVVWDNGNRNILKCLDKTCHTVTLSTTNPTWTGLGLNSALCGKRLECNQLSDGMAVDVNGICVAGINSNFVSQYCNVLPVIHCLHWFDRMWQ